MKLIAADILKESAIESAHTPYEKMLCDFICGIMDELPAIDAVPVVRCKYCHYSDEAKVNEKGFLICPASGMEITDDDFCSYGERRSDA